MSDARWGLSLLLDIVLLILALYNRDAVIASIAIIMLFITLRSA